MSSGNSYGTHTTKHRFSKTALVFGTVDSGLGSVIEEEGVDDLAHRREDPKKYPPDAKTGLDIRDLLLDETD